MERGRRAGNLADYRDLVRLAQHFNCIHMLGNQVCAPIELPANSRHLDTYLANLTLTDKSFHVSAIGRGRALDGIRDDGDRPRHDAGADARRSRRHHDHLGQLAAPLRRHDGRRADDHGRARPVGGGDAVHADGRDEPGDAGRRAGAAERRGAVRHRADAAGAAGRAGDVRRLHLQRRHALGRAGLRHAGEHQGQRRLGAAGAPLWPAVPHDAGLGLQRGRRARRLGDDDGAVGRRARPRQPRLSCRRLAGGRADGVVREVDHRRRDDPAHDGVPRPIKVDEGELALDALGRVPTGGPFLRRAPHAGALRHRLLPAAASPTGRTTRPGRRRAGSTPRQRATGVWKKALEDYVEPQLEPDVREALEAYVARRKEEIGADEP